MMKLNDSLMLSHPALLTWLFIFVTTSWCFCSFLCLAEQEPPIVLPSPADPAVQRFSPLRNAQAQQPQGPSNAPDDATGSAKMKGDFKSPDSPETTPKPSLTKHADPTKVPIIPANDEMGNAPESPPDDSQSSPPANPSADISTSEEVPKCGASAGPINGTANKADHRAVCVRTPPHLEFLQKFVMLQCPLDGLLELYKETEKVPVASDDSPEDSEPFQSFEEWTLTKMREKNGLDGSDGSHGSGGGGSLANQEPPHAATRNYASHECGAKVLEWNPEAQNVKSILNEKDRDEYLLNPCVTEGAKFVVIELCETVQPSRLDVANFELFASGPKEFRVWSSQKYPTAEWHLIGEWTAVERREIQGFQLSSAAMHYAKFLKIELLSHYGKEHYCPLSLIRVFGLSLVEEYERHDPSLSLGGLEPPKTAVPETEPSNESQALKDETEDSANATKDGGQNSTEPLLAPTLLTNETKNTTEEAGNKTGDERVNKTLFGGVVDMAKGILTQAQAVLTGSGSTQSSCDDGSAHVVHGMRSCQNGAVLRDRPGSGAKVEGDARRPLGLCTATLSNQKILPTSLTKTPETTIAKPVTEAAPGVPPLPTGSIGTSSNGNVTSSPVLDATGPALPGRTTGQHESVFIRLNNRIKNLELNISLSSQYLSELSRKYKKQMEDLNRLGNRSISLANETSKRVDIELANYHKHLEGFKVHLKEMAEAIEDIRSESTFWRQNWLWIQVSIITIQTVILSSFFWVCCARRYLARGQTANPTPQIVYYVPQLPAPGAAGDSPLEALPNGGLNSCRSARRATLVPQQQPIVPEPSGVVTVSSIANSCGTALLTASRKDSDELSTTSTSRTTGSGGDSSPTPSHGHLGRSGDGVTALTAHHDQSPPGPPPDWIDSGQGEATTTASEHSNEAYALAKAKRKKRKKRHVSGPSVSSSPSSTLLQRTTGSPSFPLVETALSPMGEHSASQLSRPQVLVSRENLDPTTTSYSARTNSVDSQ